MQEGREGMIRVLLVDGQKAGAHAFVKKEGGAEGLLETIRGLGGRSPGT